MIRSSRAWLLSSVSVPRSTALALSFAEWALPLSASLPRDVLEHDLHAGAGAGVGDPGAHHAGAEDADLGRLPGLDPGRAQLPAVDRLEVEEERLDHVRAVLVDDQLRQVARLDPAGGVEVGAGALDGRGQDRPLGRVVGALELLAEQRRERRQERRHGPRPRVAAGHRVAGGVPGVLRRVGMGGDPRPGGRHQLLAGGDQLVDQAEPLGLLRVELRTLEQHVHQRVLEPEHPHYAGDPAAAGQQPESGLREPDPHRPVIDADPVVARERDLEATAERGAVDRRDDRAWERLEPPQVGLHRLDHREDLVRVVLRRPAHPREVSAGEERLLRAGHDHAGHLVLLVVEPVDGRGHRHPVEVVHGVGAGRGVVEGEGDDPVLVPLVADGGPGLGRAGSHQSVLCVEVPVVLLVGRWAVRRAPRSWRSPSRHRRRAWRGRGAGRAAGARRSACRGSWRRWRRAGGPSRWRRR